jgi:hypothetical protein
MGVAISAALIVGSFVHFIEQRNVHDQIRIVMMKRTMYGAAIMAHMHFFECSKTRLHRHPNEQQKHQNLFHARIIPWFCEPHVRTNP